VLLPVARQQWERMVWTVVGGYNSMSFVGI
jgi:hypothetical protein